MSEHHRVENVVIHSAERTRNSQFGNPGYRFHTNKGTFQMQVNSSLGYVVSNFTNSSRPEKYVIGNPAEPEVTLWTTKYGTVFAIEYQGKVLDS